MRLRYGEMCVRCGVITMAVHSIGYEKYCIRCEKECGDLLRQREDMKREIERLRREANEPTPLDSEEE